QISRAFLPSNGVGTAYSRDVLDRLAETNSNRVFDPSCLTEDYESGVRIHILGHSQCFCVLDSAGDLTATREYFPRAFWSAVRQRTRWVMGIALQSWERNGWRGQLRTKYWFWRAYSRGCGRGRRTSPGLCGFIRRLRFGSLPVRCYSNLSGSRFAWSAFAAFTVGPLRCWFLCACCTRTP